jgi:hypothetical protein
MNCFTTIVLLILFQSLATAQSRIYPIYNDGNTPDDYTNVYFKDMNNDLDKYDGTWVWEENGKKLTVILEKAIQYYLFSSYYEDVLLGNYKYEENGTTIVDTITNSIIDPNLTDDGYHITLWGDNQTPFITYMRGIFVDPVRSNYASYSLWCDYITPVLSLPSEPKQIRMTVILNGYTRNSIDEVIDTTLPYGSRIPQDVILTKQ